MHLATPSTLLPVPSIILRKNFYYSIHLYIIHIHLPCPFLIFATIWLMHLTISSPPINVHKIFKNILLTDIDTLPSLSTIIYSRDDDLGHCTNILMQAKLDNSSYYFVLRSFQWSLREFQKLSQKWSESCHKYASHFTCFIHSQRKNLRRTSTYIFLF